MRLRGADDPQMVVTMLPSTSLTGDDLLASALVGITKNPYSTEQAAAMVKELARRMQAKEPKE